MRYSLEATFKVIGTHELDLNIDAPPSSWIQPYAEMAEECGLSKDITVGFKQLASFLKKVK